MLWLVARELSLKVVRRFQRYALMMFNEATLVDTQSKLIISLELTVKWSAPEDDGGSTITDYVVEYRDFNRTAWLYADFVKSDKLTMTVSHYLDDTDYVVRVFAENAVGSVVSRQL
jgi:hypothetical protein